MTLHGLRTRPLGDVLVLMPPLGIEDSLLTALVEKLTRAVHDVLPS